MRIKLSSGKLTVNGNEYKIPNEVAEAIIWLMSTKEDLQAMNDIYKKKIDEAILICENNLNQLNSMLNDVEMSYMNDFNDIENILKEK